MSNIAELLKDKEYISKLFGVVTPTANKSKYIPINTDWIDDELSDKMTRIAKDIFPDEVPYMPYVIAEKNPDTICNEVAVDSNEKRMRYFVIMILPDTEYPYNCTYPLFHEMWRASFFCREMMRASTAAALNYSYVRLVDELEPPILNNAVIEWVSIYLGREPYKGITLMSEQWLREDEYDGKETDTNLYKPREMEYNPILQPLIDAYDRDFPKKD